MSKFFVDVDGRPLGWFDGATPAGGIEVAGPPDGRCAWTGGEWTLGDPHIAAAIKTEAGRRILGAYPDWVQANMTARAVELTRARVLGTITPAEEAEEAVLQAAWDWIKAVRAYSNTLEAQVAAMTPAERLAFVPAAQSWPAQS